jgi:hypothetical protein
MLRRIFIVCFALAATVANARDDIVTGDTLQSPDLRLSVTKPAEWRFLTPKEKRAARDAKPFVNAELAYLIRQNPFPPRIVIARYPEPRVELNPGVSIDRYPLDDYRLKDGLWIAGRVVHNRQRLLNHVEIVEPTAWRTLGGRAAGYCHIRFTLEMKGAPAYHVDERTWAIASPLSTFLIIARCSQDDPPEVTQAIDAVIASIHFDGK